MERTLVCEIPDKRRKTCVQCLFFLETEVEQFWCPPFVMPQSAETELSTQKTLQGKIASNTIHSFQTFSVHSLRGRQKKGRGRGEGEKRQREKGREVSAVSSLSPQSPSLFPFLPNPYPFGHLLRRPQHTPSQVLSPTLEEWSRFFPKQVHHINVPLQVPHTEQKKTEVKQHLIRDKFLSNPIK